MAPSKGSEFKPETYERLTALIKSRLNTIKNVVDNLCTQVEPLNTVQVKSLNSHMNEINKKKADYESIVERVLMCTDESTLSNDVLSRDQDEIDDLYVHISSHIESVISPENPTTTTSVSNNDSLTSNGHSQVRLPKIELPKFTGDLATWTSFINLFDTTIHQNTALSNVMKFQYLLSLLHDKPLSLIRSLSLTEENYIIAYNLLRERYHNNRRLQLLHLNKILDLPQISSTNVNGIRQFVNSFNENSQALNALKCNIQDPNPLLTAVVLRKLDLELRKKLEDSRTMTLSLTLTLTLSANHTLPTIKEIIDFLNTECSHFEDASLAPSVQVAQSITDSSRHKSASCVKTYPKKGVSMVATTQCTPSANTQTPLHCIVCNQSTHKLYSCPMFKAKTPQERYQIVKGNRQCVSCLGSHDIKNCKSQSSCKVCHKRHNTLLHFNVDSLESETKQSNERTISSKSSKSENGTTSKTDTSVTLTSQNKSDIHCNVTVLLGTLMLKLKSPDGTSHMFRALIDSGSMCNLITEHAASILNIRRHKCDIQLSGIDHHVTQNNGQIFVSLETLSGQQIVEQFPMLILSKLTVDLPRMPISSDVIKHTQSLTLADPTFHLPGRIDVVLGAALFPLLFTHEQFSLGDNMPHVLVTRFGYVLMGTAPCVPTNTASSNVAPATTLNICLHSISDSDLHSSIQQFWHQEEPPMCSRQSKEDDMCDAHFARTHSRDDNGRYVVRLPFKDSNFELGSSRQAAELRLHAMERKFSNNDHFSHLYHEFMDEYINLGHMSKLDSNLPPDPHYYLPHHGVLKENSSTTKLRTVFDASCKTSSGLSLNDHLLTGRKLQTNICDTLLQFRRHNFVFCCVIKQMYRQISVYPDDRNFQLILWRTDPKQPVSTYQLNTVTYGMNSSPYLAIRTLHQLAEDEGEVYPQAAKVLRNHTYVDDIITGAYTEDEAITLQTELISLLSRGCFELRKWVSNSTKLLHNLPETHLESPMFLQNSQAPHFTVLGLQWSPTTDMFSYKFELPNTFSTPTKRIVLSTVAKIYDPCGFLTPFIMVAKCFMQLIWTRGISWDSPLPADLQAQWQSFTDDIQWLSQVSIPRTLNLSASHQIELHGFCDASESGYAAVVYFRCEHSSGMTSVNLIMAKSIVAPLKRVTIPRLESCAAHLLAQLVSYCRTLFADIITSDKIHLWSDSSVVLTWLRTPAYRLKTYVANRVSQTQELVPPDSWKHISSEHNPADCASRGLLVSHLVNHSLWWNGPPWLSLPPFDWPKSKFTPVELDPSQEIKSNPLPVLSVNQIEECSILTKFSSWITLLHVMAFVLRFIRNSRSMSHRTGHLTTYELQEARLRIFYLVQQTAFSKELKSVSQHHVWPKQMQRLNPFIDNNKLIRVGGRLSNTSLPYDTQHPILLPKNHHVVNLLIDYYHMQNLHAGPQLVQSLLAQEVWILCARSIIRSRIFKCLTCFRQRPTNTNPLMVDLPTVRTNPAKPFLSTGVDYGGPFNIKITNLRFTKQIKVYICLFICMVTKAVHIEVATDLSTEAFLACLTRFISRRGQCTDLYSDCGTNFIGANTELRKIVQSTIQNSNSQHRIQKFVTTHGIKFHFNPPSAPHHGGLWESAIKSAKHHLQRVIGNNILTLPDFITLTVRVEAMLNSRPLTPLSSNPSDLSALTPGHFLVGGPLTSLPEPDRTTTPPNRLKHYQLLQQLFQHIWKRWRLEYLHTLQQRTKWTANNPNLKIGDLVLVKSQSSPLSWPLARVLEVFPGSDGIVRVAKIRTMDGTLLRPVVKLYPLPIYE